jgi:exonuclease SbcD
MGPERGWYEAYAGRLEQILDFLTLDFTPRTVNLVLAHLLVAGARFGTGERQLHLGDIYGVNAEQLPARAQYVALGHLHRPQELMAPTKAAYSGSLIELDFGEREQDKRVVIVEARPGGGASLQSVPLSAGRRLRDLTGTFEELRAQAAEMGDAFLRVTVKAPAPEPGLAERVKELLPGALEVTVDYPKPPSPPGSAAVSARSLQPAELFAQFYEKKNEAPPSPELRDLFQSVYDEAHG